MIDAIATLTITDLLGFVDLTVSSPEALNRRPEGFISLGPGRVAVEDCAVLPHAADAQTGRLAEPCKSDQPQSGFDAHQ
jgi:hypothetical protein